MREKTIAAGPLTDLTVDADEGRRADASKGEFILRYTGGVVKAGIAGAGHVAYKQSRSPMIIFLPRFLR